MLKLSGKVAVVTGGASGLGLATVKAFLEEGANVVIGDYSEAGEEVARKLGGEDRVRFFHCDVSKEENIKALFTRTKEWFGPVDVVFANAGITDGIPAHELTLSQWQRAIDVNLSGVFLTDKYAIEQMLAAGKGGSIINCASILGHVGQDGVTSYSASKAGVVNLTRTLGITYAKQGIRVNAVCPGYVDTPLLDILDDEKKQQLVALHPIGRFGREEEIAKPVVFLASDDASFVVGASLLVDGGYTAQ